MKIAFLATMLTLLVLSSVLFSCQHDKACCSRHSTAIDHGKFSERIPLPEAKTIALPEGLSALDTIACESMKLAREREPSCPNMDWDLARAVFPESVKDWVLKTRTAEWDRSGVQEFTGLRFYDSNYGAARQISVKIGSPFITDHPVLLSKGIKLDLQKQIIFMEWSCNPGGRDSVIHYRPYLREISGKREKTSDGSLFVMIEPCLLIEINGTEIDDYKDMLNFLSWIDLKALRKLLVHIHRQRDHLRHP